MTNPAANISQRDKAGIYTVPAHAPLMDAVAQGIMADAGRDPLALADMTILVPDREAATALRKAFTKQGKGKTLMLPRIQAIGELDDDHNSLNIAHNPVLAQALLELPPAVTRLDRQLVLAQEVLKIQGMASSPQKAVKLGAELGKFLDLIQRHEIDLSRLEELVAPAFRQQWMKTAEFLRVITDTWPQKLAEMGRIDPEDHKNAVLQIHAAYWADHQPTNPVIAVGFNEDTPALREVLRAIKNLPQGAIVFQGLDTALDAQSWDALTPLHPQYVFKELLGALDIDRNDVKQWAGKPLLSRFARALDLDATNQAREKLLRETMRPSGTAEGWTALMAPKKKGRGRPKKSAAPAGGIAAEALNGMDLITCATQQEEASVIALKLREVLEQKGRTATLVTADRALAARVTARLRRWKIELQDDTGTPLSATPVGVYLLSTAAMAAEEWAPVPLLEALKHPLTALGGDQEEFRRKILLLEDMVFHGPRPGFGAKGVKGVLSAAFNRAARKPKDGLTREQILAEKYEMEDFVDILESAGRKFFTLMADKTAHPFSVLLEEHIRFAEMLGGNGQTPGSIRLWQGEDGVKAARFLAQLRDVAKLAPDVTGRGYIDILQGLMKDVTVENKVKSHPVLRITTPEKAQTIKSDIIILAGLNDEVWPRRVNENPWLSPDMIKALGLPDPAVHIGRSAHTFVQMMSNPNVLLTRSLRAGDGPAVSSPFLTRLMMVLKGAGLDGKIDKKTPLLDIHRAMNTPAKVTPVDAPHVTPPVSARPKQLPVTAVEMLMRDPYAVYVKYILRLKQKPPLDTSPSVAERGIFTHDALDAFVRKYPEKLPPNAEKELLKIGAETFKERINNPSVRAFWWPRFERIAKWFVKFEENRRQISATLGTEVRGKLDIDLGDGVFTLTTIADRVDIANDDTLTIIDYKTGTVPTQKAVSLGMSPQLTLEALIAFTGGFDGIDAAPVGKLEYWKLSGSATAGDVTQVKSSIERLVDEARDGIEKLIRAFNDKSMPYLVAPRPDWAPRYNGALHLSRIDEWSTVKKTAPEKKARAARQQGSKRRPK